MGDAMSDVVHSRLGSGAHVLVQPRRHLPLVSLAIAARGGSLLEGRAQAGLTALMSRASIKGTAKRTAAQIAEEAEAMGGSVAPGGGADIVDWEISVPSRHFERALDLVCDVALNAAFPEQELEIERTLTLAELERTRDDMYRYPLRLCLQTAFADHPYGYTLQDVERGVRAATQTQLREWQAQRITREPWIVVTGDVAPEDVVRRVEAVLPSKLDGTAPAPPRAQWRNAGRRTSEARDKAQTALALAFPGPAHDHEDVHVLRVLANAAGGLGGRFFEELRSKRSLAYTVALLPLNRLAGGAFIGYIATSPEREDEARAGLLEQFASLIERPLAEADIERARRYTIGTWQIRRQTNSARLHDLLEAYVLGRGQAEIDEFEERIRAVTREQVRAVAERYFRPELVVEGLVRGTGKAR